MAMARSFPLGRRATLRLFNPALQAFPRLELLPGRRRGKISSGNSVAFASIAVTQASVSGRFPATHRSVYHVRFLDPVSIFGRRRAPER